MTEPDMPPHEAADPEMQVEKRSLLEIEAESFSQDDLLETDESKVKRKNPLSSYQGRRRILFTFGCTMAASCLLIVVLGKAGKVIVGGKFRHGRDVHPNDIAKRDDWIKV